MNSAEKIHNPTDEIQRHPAYKRHPASAAQPDLTDDEKAALRQSIRDHGQRVPILATRDDQIIDGWHRLNACWETFKDPIIETIPEADHEPGRLAALVSGLIRGRRHMTKSDLARIDIRIKRSCGIKWADRGDRRNGQTGHNVPSPPHPLSRPAVAAAAGSSNKTAARILQSEKRREKTIQQKATESGKRATRKAQAKQAAFDEISILREIAEGLQEENEILKAENLRMRSDLGDVDQDEALAEAQGTIESSRRQNQDLRKRIKVERNRRQTAEQNAAYWEAYARRLDDHGSGNG